MASYAGELTELDMAVGRSAIGLHATLQALFEHQTRKVDMEQLPVPTRDDWGVGRRIVDNAVAANEADRWVGIVANALHQADGGGQYGLSLSLVHDADVSEQQFNEALQGLFPPLMASGNIYDDPAAFAEWNSLANCGERGYGSLVGGVFYGPDGRPYPVAMPGEGDGGSESGWSTLGSRRGDLELGEPLSGFERFAVVAGAAVGGGYKMHGWQSVGSDQSAYLAELPGGGSTFGRPPGGGPPTPTHWSGRHCDVWEPPHMAGRDAEVAGAEHLESLARRIEGWADAAREEEKFRQRQIERWDAEFDANQRNATSGEEVPR